MLSTVFGPGGLAPLTCQAVVALDLGALHGSPLLLGQLGGGLAQQVDLGARRPVDHMHPLELQQRPVVLAYRLPEFLLLVAAMTLRLEVDGFLDLQLHLRFSRAGPIPAVSSGGRRQAPAAGFRVAFQALYRMLFSLHVSQWTQLKRAIVLGHVCVFCRGGPEQLCIKDGTRRRRQAGTRERQKRRKAANKAASRASPLCGWSLNNSCLFLKSKQVLKLKKPAGTS